MHVHERIHDVVLIAAFILMKGLICELFVTHLLNALMRAFLDMVPMCNYYTLEAFLALISPVRLVVMQQCKNRTISFGGASLMSV